MTVFFDRLSAFFHGPADKVVTQRKRHFPRFAVKVAVTVRTGATEICGTTAKLGLGGLFLICPQPLPADTRVNVTLGPSPAIFAQGRVAYLETGGMGIRFTGLTPDDSRRLKDICYLGC